jgi:hypothetical protein
MKMKITYNKNPLDSTIELNEYEIKELWYKIKLAEMEDLLLEAHFNVEEGKYFDLEKARKKLNPEYYCSDDKTKLDERCDTLLTYYLEELKSNHCGDCTCVACSCGKCHAEALLGINTTKGLGKHSAYKIDGAFGTNNEKSIDEAIESLANYNPGTKGPAWNKFSQEEFNKYIPRWMDEAKTAHDWLVNYKTEHFAEIELNNENK